MFKDAISTQLVDEDGKTRMLNFTKNVSLITSPLNIIEKVPLNRTVKVCDFEKALQFIRDNDFQITFKNMNDKNEIIGLWIEPSFTSPLSYGYIPIVEKNNDSIFWETDVPVKREEPPVFVKKSEEMTELVKLKAGRKISYILQEFSLYLSSLNGAVPLTDEDFIIIHDYKYSKIDTAIGNKLTVNSLLFQDKKLIVPNEEIRDKLILHVKTVLENDFEDVKNKSKIGIMSFSTMYKNLHDFKDQPSSQSIISEPEKLREWKKINDSKLSISKILNTTTHEPYYYTSEFVRHQQIVLIQNVKNGDLKRAISVAKEWCFKNINKGYDADQIDDLEFKELTDTNKIQFYNEYRQPTVVVDYKNVNILSYGNNSYAAILPL